LKGKDDMSRYDDKIKSNLEKIAKLQDEIEKRKAKITILQNENKQLQAEKDNEFSQTLLKKLAELGINSPEDRVALMSKLEDFALEQEIAKSETKTQNENSSSSPDSETLQKTEKFSTTAQSKED
jgi:ABC-type Fe3+-citrate transport system substrate-binding protein